MIGGPDQLSAPLEREQVMCLEVKLCSHLINRAFCTIGGVRHIPVTALYNMATNPMTKLWYMTLKPATNMSMLPFRQLWTEVLDFVSGASGPVSSGHHLWQDTTSPNILVMLSGYPSYGSNQAADKAYVEKGYLKRRAEFVDHGKLLQIEIGSQFATD